MERVRGSEVLRTLSRSIGARLLTLLGFVLLLILGALGYMNLRLHRRDLERSSLTAADRVSDVILRSTSYHMMRNDRAALYHTIQTMGREPGMVSVRIINQAGQVSFSTDATQIGRVVDQAWRQCTDCVTFRRGQGASRYRIFNQNGTRVLGIITPILNAPSCASADCHAHPIENRVLGVLDTNLSLADADRHLASSSRTILLYSLAAVIAIALISAVFVVRYVHRPVQDLLHGTQTLARGDLGFQIDVHSSDDLGELAASFNEMSRQLAEAQDELTAWARTLEERVAAKSSELRRAHDQMVQAEKLTSLGKLAAVVAHEINNPLSAILTYAKLISRWIERGDELESHRQEVQESLALIAAESRRCGDLVRSLLTFARVPPMNTGDVNVNAVIEQTLKLVEHKLELANIALHLDLADGLPTVYGDAAQLEQLFLALMMNAIDAIGREGNLFVSSWITPEKSIAVEVRDDGCGIDEEIMTRIFDPFLTTKEAGVGLGLAISRTIVERHGGDIKVESTPGQGATFSVRLPVGTRPTQNAREAAMATA
jgi:two-component system NtrC family sensor kinase